MGSLNVKEMEWTRFALPCFIVRTGKLLEDLLMTPVPRDIAIVLQLKLIATCNESFVVTVVFWSTLFQKVTIRSAHLNIYQ